MDDQERSRWTRLVADFESSDLTQLEFANERGVPVSKLRSWIYRLRKESRPLVTDAPVRAGQAPERTAHDEGSPLVPVRMVASAAKRRRAETAPRAGDDHLELVLPSGTLVRFPAGTDLRYLQALAAAL